MGDDGAPERIEIELVSSGAEPSPFARGGDPQRMSARPDPADRSRSIVLAAMVGVLALALGWMLGRSTADEGQARSATTTTEGRTNLVEPIEPVEPDETAPSAAARASSSPATPPPLPSVTAPPRRTGIVVTQADVATPLAGRPIEIVAVGNGRRLLRLDLATGRLTNQPATGQPFGRARVFLGDEWILFPSGDAILPSTVVGADGTVGAVGLGPGRNLLGDPDAGLWRITSDLLGGQRFTIEPIAIDGSVIGPTVELPGSPTGFDPAGGFVVAAAGGVYAVGDAVTSRITTGQLLALGADIALADECDETLACSLVVIDRSTGDRRPLELHQPIGPSRRRSFERVAGTSVSPDGGAAIVRVLNPIERASSQPTLGIIDLETSEVVEIGPAQSIDESVWMPDSRYVLYNAGGRVVAFDREERTEVLVADELIAIDTFAIRERDASRSRGG